MSRRRERSPVGCPCDLGAPYDRCCGPLHRGETRAATAEALMRSRYSAFAVGDAPYLLRTWHASTRPVRLDLDDSLRWTALEVLATTGGGLLEPHGTVAFRARAVRAGRPEVVSEESRFVRDAGLWTYLGPVSQTPAPGADGPDAP